MQQSISVIIPYYRGLKFIGKCIDSIFESYRTCNVKFDLEVIVVLDGFGQEDLDYLKKHYDSKVNIIKNEKNLGVSQSRNTGKKHAQNDFMLFIDQDDFIDVKYFTVIVPFLNSDKYDIILVNGYYLNSKNSKTIPIYYFKPNLRFNAFLKKTRIHTPGQILINSKSFPYDDFFPDCDKQYKGADDRAAYINAYINNREIQFKYIDEKLFYYVLHENNFGKDIFIGRKSEISMCEYFMDKVSAKRGRLLQSSIKKARFEMEILKSRSVIVAALHHPSCFLNYLRCVLNLNKIIGLIHKRLICFEEKRWYEDELV